MHRDIGFNRIIDMIIVIELNRETSADLHPYYLTLLNYLPIYSSTIQLCTQISTYLPIYLPIYPSTAQLSIHLPPNYLSIYRPTIYPSTAQLSIHLPNVTYLSIHLPLIYLPTYPFTAQQSTYLSQT